MLLQKYYFKRPPSFSLSWLFGSRSERAAAAEHGDAAAGELDGARLGADLERGRRRFRVRNEKAARERRTFSDAADIYFSITSCDLNFGSHDGPLAPALIFCRLKLGLPQGSGYTSTAV